MYWVAIAQIISLSKTKLIFTEHNTTNRRMDNPLFKWIEILIYKQYDVIVTISDAVNNKLHRYLGNRFTNLHKINNGINLKKFIDAKAYPKNEL